MPNLTQWSCQHLPHATLIGFAYHSVKIMHPYLHLKRCWNRDRCPSCKYLLFINWQSPCNVTFLGLLTIWSNVRLWLNLTHCWGATLSPKLGVSNVQRTPPRSTSFSPPLSALCSNLNSSHSPPHFSGNSLISLSSRLALSNRGRFWNSTILLYRAGKWDIWYTVLSLFLLNWNSSWIAI